uniref:Uncharacterized protein n=1 Tax=Timema genevievae TaxID=629358 RepID=A0A7R9K274_TIMGE|nr:unnamed protein product [Timema genevievae]
MREDLSSTLPHPYLILRIARTDALLEDLQTGVSRPSTVTMNGLGTGTRAYRQEIRTIQQHTSAVPDSGQYVQYLSAANPTTVVSERSISPGTIGLQHAGDPHTATAYKTVSYQYNTRDIQQPIETRVIESSSDPASDARLRQNLTELDSLLVDLHQAQKTGFSTNQGGAVPGAGSGIDPGLLESIDITPDPPARQQSQPKQHVSRTIEQRTYTTRYNDQPASPRLQPKRSSSAQRELTYGIIDSGRSRSGRSPSPVRQSRDSSDSPRVPQRSPAVHREVYYETKTSGNSVPASPPRTHYRDKSPSNQRLHRELYYENNRTTSPSPTRYREPSPPPQRRGPSPVQERYPQPPTTYHVTERHVTSHNQHGQPYPGPQGGEVAVVTPTPNKKVPPEIKRELRGQSKNVAGPAVYYPPGVELFANKDQSMQMASMKGSGKYEYEMSRESKDKSSSGGAAVVPVCLPLCCAMPCVIM